MSEPHPRRIATDPWRSLDQMMESLIDKVVIEMNPETLDDNLADLLDDWDNRENAINYLLLKLKQKRGGE